MSKLFATQRSWQNSEVETDDKAAYLDPSVRKVKFAVNQGQRLMFLPAYRADGAWYRKIKIRRDFGDKFRKAYFVLDVESDPAEYFARNCRNMYPELAQPQDKYVEKIKKSIKEQPKFGKLADRVLFNVLPEATYNQIAAGTMRPQDAVMILDLPAANGADKLLKIQQGVNSAGHPNPIISDPNMFTVVEIVKEDGANPWSCTSRGYVSQVQTPGGGTAYVNNVLCPALQDPDLFYNLDTITPVPPNEEIIATLRDAFGARVFDDCMDGFPGLIRSVRQPARVLPIAGQPQEPQAPATQPFVPPQAAPVQQPIVAQSAPLAGAPVPPPGYVPQPTVTQAPVPQGYAPAPAPVAQVYAPAPAPVQQVAGHDDQIPGLAPVQQVAQPPMPPQAAAAPLPPTPPPSVVPGIQQPAGLPPVPPPQTSAADAAAILRGQQ